MRQQFRTIFVPALQWVWNKRQANGFASPCPLKMIMIGSSLRFTRQLAILGLTQR